MPQSLVSPSLAFRVGSGTECLAEFRTWVCPVDGTLVDRRVTCDDERLCPECSKLWAWREAAEVERRLACAKEVFEPRHVVVSPNDQTGVRTAEDISRLRTQAWGVLRRMGARGAVLVVHGWRHRPEDACTVWVDGPHVHALVFGRVDADKRPRSVVVRTVRREQANVGGTIAYLLNHAATSPRQHAVAWVGSLSYRKLKAGRRERRTAPSCPVCGAEMEPIEGLVDRTGWDPRWWAVLSREGP